MKQYKWKMAKIKNRKCTPFTIIEILAAVVIIAFLTTISIAGFKAAQNKAFENATISIIKQIEMAMEEHKKKYGYYIQQPNGGNLIITNLIEFLPEAEGWKKSGIISGTSLYDPYGVAFWTRSPGYHNRASFDLESAGSDKEWGYAGTANELNEHAVIGTDGKQGDNINNWNM